jgi:hypothetical protein
MARQTLLLSAISNTLTLQIFQRVVIKLIPSHYNLKGNEEADRLEKKGGLWA